MLNRLFAFFKKEAVLCIATALALLSAFWVPPSGAYLVYIDFRVLALLFCLMLVVAGLQDIGLFRFLGARLLAGAGSTRQLCLILVLLCFFSSMLITNDVALITFVPFAVMILTMADQTGLLIPVIVLQTLAANLGSMLTPIGNPQNLYLYSAFSLSMGSFLLTMLPLTLLSLGLLLAAVLLLKNAPLALESGLPDCPAPATPRLLGWLLLFGVCLGCVLRVLPWPIMLVILCGTVLLLDRTLFAKVDYFLLLTFVCFFVFKIGRAHV